MTPIPKPHIHPPVRPLTGGKAVLAFGSNLGDRDATIRAGLDALAAHGIRISAMSTLVESVAVKPGGEDEAAPRYLNGVALVSTVLAPHDLLRAIHAVEAELGRVRVERWGDRTLDIDIVAYGDLILDDQDLVLPHPRAAQRAFVLSPWLELDPDAVLPGSGRVDALLAALEAQAGAGA